MILYRNGVVSAADVPAYLVVWDLTGGLLDQDRHTQSIIDRWPFVQEAIDNYLFKIGALPGDVVTFKIDDDRSVIVVFVNGKVWPEQINRALKIVGPQKVAIGAEYANGIVEGDVEIWG